MRQGDNHNVQSARLAFSVAGMVNICSLQPVQHSTDCQGYVRSYKHHSVMHVGSMSCGVSLMCIGTASGTASLHAEPNSQDDRPDLYLMPCSCFAEP